MDKDRAERKTDFFVNRALKNRDGLRLHKNNGLWDREGSDSRSWGNVSEHCLVVAARAEVLADWVGLSESAKDDLIKGAVVHDFYKRREKEFLRDNPGFSALQWSEYLAGAESILKNAGFNERVVSLAQCLGDEKLPDLEDRVEKENINEDDLCFMILHYVDDYTMGNNWVVPSEGGENDFERRISKLEDNADYSQINNTVLFFEGETAFQAQRRVGRLVQKRLTEIINERNGTGFTPLSLPEVTDQKIRERMFGNK